MNAKTQVNVITQIDYDSGLETAQAYFDQNPLYFAWGVAPYQFGASQDDYQDYGSVVAYYEVRNETDYSLIPINTRPCTPADF